VSVQDIYTRLRTVPDFHPASAELFDDFLLEPGDVISVVSDGEHYALPIFAQHIVWNGSAMVTVQSQGEQERGPLPALQRRQFSYGRGGYAQQQETEMLYRKFEKFVEDTDERFSRIMTENEWDEAAQASTPTAWSQITQTAREITSLVAKTGVNSLGQDETLYSLIHQNAESITTKVSAGDIASTINQTAQSVLIQASKIDLQGYVTASDLSATNAQITNLMSGTTIATALKAGVLQANNGLFLGSTPADYRTISLGRIQSISVLSAIPSANKDFDHSHSITMSESSGVVTATLGAAVATDDAGRTANFNIADTAFYQNAVSAAYDRGYADGSAAGTAPTVTGVARNSAQATTYSSSVYTVPVIVSFSDGTTQTAAVNISVSNSSYSAENKNYTLTVAGNSDRTLDASAAYDAGKVDNRGVGTIRFTTQSKTNYDQLTYTEVTLPSTYYLLSVQSKSGSGGATAYRKVRVVTP